VFLPEAPEGGQAERLLLPPDLPDFGDQPVGVEGDRVLELRAGLGDLVFDFQPWENSVSVLDSPD